MINISEVLETNKMILEENLDVRTITMGISLLDCADASLKKTCDNVYAKLMRLAKNLVKTGDEIGREFGVPIVNKRISITPAAIVGSVSSAKRKSPTNPSAGVMSRQITTGGRASCAIPTGVAG